LSETGSGAASGLPSLSLVISVYNSAAHLERCLGSVVPHRPELLEAIVVDDGSQDHGAAVAARYGCEVIMLPERRGISTARNTGARAAAGEVLVFIDADTEVGPGWAQALRRAYAAGAVLAGGEIGWPQPQTLAEWHTAGSRWHDAEARNGFLPFVSGAHFTIRRDVFLSVGGFDESMPLAEDLDLSLRVQLAGHPISFVPEARLTHWPRRSVSGMLRQRAGHARGRRLTEAKFREFPFLRMDRGRRGVGRTVAASTTRLLMAGTGGDRRRLASPLLAGSVAAAKRVGMAKADLQLMAGLIPMPPAVPYADPAQHNIASALPRAASVLLIGEDRFVLGLLRLTLEHSRGVILAPPGLERDAVARWEEPAPWSMRLVRSALRCGWPLALETTALRLEREQPRTWGEAYLTMNGIYAWAHERPRFGLAAHGQSGWELASWLPEVPLVVAGDHRGRWNGAALYVTRADLARRRRRVYERLLDALPPPPGR
jgi:GT2 family glycosyltransferase